nr:MAG TPA: Chitin oligosaccharide deacetylase [Caudoviricetes sp.]
MALEITNRNAIPTVGGYSSVNITFTLRNGTVYLNGGVDLPGKFATASDSEILEEVRKQLAQQMFTGESTPALVTEYANLKEEISVLANHKEEPTDRVKALRKLVAKVNKGNDKLIMTLLLNVLDAKIINDNKDTIINAFDNYEIGVEYSTGDKIKYEGKLYEVLEDHISVEVWKPNAEGTKYKEIVLTREEANVKDDIEDEKNRYITKGQLDEAMGSVINTILSMLEEEEKEDEHTEEHNGNLPHNEGSTESHETE